MLHISRFSSFAIEKIVWKVASLLSMRNFMQNLFLMVIFFVERFIQKELVLIATIKNRLKNLLVTHSNPRDREYPAPTSRGGQTVLRVAAGLHEIG